MENDPKAKNWRDCTIDDSQAPTPSPMQQYTIANSLCSLCPLYNQITSLLPKSVLSYIPPAFPEKSILHANHANHTSHQNRSASISPAVTGLALATLRGMRELLKEIEGDLGSIFLCIVDELTIVPKACCDVPAPDSNGARPSGTAA